MLLSCAIDQRIEEKSARNEIDHGRARDAGRINISARKPGSNRRANVTLPNHGAGGGAERINVVRLSYRDHHWPVRSALDVKRLRINVADDRAVETKIARQISGSRRRKGC